MIQDWFWRTSTLTSSYIPVLLRLVFLLYLVTLTLQLGDCYEVTCFLQEARVFDDLPVEFSKKIVYALQMRSCNNFTRIFADALAAVGNHMVVLGSPKGRPLSRDINACIISYENLSDVNKIMGLLCPEGPSAIKMEAHLHEEINSNIQTCDVESRRELCLSDENIPFWEKFESFQVYLHSQVSARVIIQFLRCVLSWLGQRGPTENIDAELLEDVRNLCNEFPREEKRACLTVEDLYSTWQDGEDKLQKIIRFLRSEQASSIEYDGMAEKASADQFHKDRDADWSWSECSVDGPGTGGRDVELEQVKEEATAVCTTSKAKAKKQKKKKPKCSRRKSKK